MQQSTPAPTWPTTRSSSKSGAPPREAKEALNRDIKLFLQKEIKEAMASAVADNLRTLEEALKQNCAEASNTIEEVCEE